jgi:hypothetical protein
MQQLIKNRIKEIVQEISLINDEKTRLYERQKEIDVKLHQLVGAVYELQQLIDNDTDAKIED